MATIAFLGLGSMGTRMASHLIKAGHSVTVWNRNVERLSTLAALGAQVATSPRQAASQADYVISMVRDDPASEAVWCDPVSGALSGMQAQGVAIECSTLSVEWVKSLAQQCQNRSIAFLDAPVAGSRPQAEAAQLIFLVGGQATVFEQAKPILAAMSSAVHYAGEQGAGACLKLGINTLFGVQLAALAELMGLFHATGLEVAHLIEILTTTPVCSPAVKGAAQSMLNQNFSPMFPIDLVLKDLDYAMAYAEQLRTLTPITVATQEVYQKASTQGYGADNITGVVQLYKKG